MLESTAQPHLLPAPVREAAALYARINHHFVFNCLNSLNALLLQNQPELACQYLGKFSALMRQLLNGGATDTIALADEIEFLDAYLQLESLRLDGRLTYEIRVDDELDPFAVRLPAMLLQPLVENAVHHGITPKAEGGMITVRFKKTPSGWEVHIVDNGVGRARAQVLNAARTRKHASIGLVITTKRLTDCSSRSGLRADLTVSDLYDGAGNAAGTAVILRFQTPTAG